MSEETIERNVQGIERTLRALLAPPLGSGLPEPMVGGREFGSFWVGASDGGSVIKEHAMLLKTSGCEHRLLTASPQPRSVLH